MSDKGFDYDLMVENAMRGVLREALAYTEVHGLPGGHHFYISLDTNAPDVVMPSRLKAQYQEEMTIVIQHQYWNLHVSEEMFEIELGFNGKHEHLVVPFAAVTGFVDPEAQFGLRFGADGMVSPEEEGAPHHAQGPAKSTHRRAGEDEAGPRPGTGESPPAGADEKVVTLDQFRKK